MKAHGRHSVGRKVHSPRSRRLHLVPLEERTLLSASPHLVDLLASGDSGMFSDDNLTNVPTQTVEIMADQAGDVIRIYRQDTLLGEATQVTGTLYQYAFSADGLAEGSNTITARSFDRTMESKESPPLATTFDTTSPRITASTTAVPVNLRNDTLDSIALTFSEASDFEPVGGGTVTTSDVTITGPQGAVIPTGIADLGGSQCQTVSRPA